MCYMLSADDCYTEYLSKTHITTKDRLMNAYYIPLSRTQADGVIIRPLWIHRPRPRCMKWLWNNIWHPLQALWYMNWSIFLRNDMQIGRISLDILGAILVVRPWFIHVLSVQDAPLSLSKAHCPPLIKRVWSVLVLSYVHGKWQLMIRVILPCLKMCPYYPSIPPYRSTAWRGMNVWEGGCQSLHARIQEHHASRACMWLSIVN